MPDLEERKEIEMPRCRFVPAAAALVLFTLASGSRGRADEPKPAPAPSRSAAVVAPAVSHYSARMLQEGQNTFRYDTFGDEAFWGGALRLHEAIAGEKHGGKGPGVSPKTALSVGLKVDSDALPPALVAKLKAGNVDLGDPATTLALLELNSVVGLTGFFDKKKVLTAVGIQCSFCHSTVDDSLAPGIGSRRDGWANRDLNVGAIIALAPDLSVVTTLLGVDDATLRKVLNGWGPGKFDAAVFLDGKALRPDGKPAATLIPPAFGLLGVNLHTWTGWGSVTHWNAFVAVLEMQGKGTRRRQPLRQPAGP